MSLSKKPEMTPEKIAANQANRHFSHGPATPEGLERRRDAKTLHGFHSQAEGDAPRALGEHPDGFKALLKDVIEEWQPARGFEARLVKRLARALWKCECDDRLQESVAVRQLQNLDKSVARRIREAEARFKQGQSTLKVLVDANKKQDFCTGFGRVERVRIYNQPLLPRYAAEAHPSPGAINAEIGRLQPLPSGAADQNADMHPRQNPYPKPGSAYSI